MCVWAGCSCSAVGVDKWVAPKPSDSTPSPLTGTPQSTPASVCVCASLSPALSHRHNWQAVSLISVQLLWSLNTVLPLFPNTSIMLAKCERHTDMVQWLSLIAHQPKQPLASAGGELPKLLGGGRPTLRIPFYKGKELCMAWLATVGVGFRMHCALFDVFEGFLLILASYFDLCKTKYSQIP